MITCYLPPSKEFLSRQAGIISLTITLLLLTGCTVISNDRVFPKLAPFWTAEAKAQRESNAQRSESKTP